MKLELEIFIEVGKSTNMWKLSNVFLTHLKIKIVNLMLLYFITILNSNFFKLER